MVPPVDRDELKAALSGVVTEFGRCSAVGSFVWISDALETVRKMASDLEEIRTRSERSCLAEAYFVRANEKDFVRLTTDSVTSAVSSGRQLSYMIKGKQRTSYLVKSRTAVSADRACRVPSELLRCRRIGEPPSKAIVRSFGEFGSSIV
jgi:hypothetical protein